MSSKPVPIISEAPVFELTDLPIATVTLSGAASEPSTGATSIVGWLWTLHSKPPGSNATLFNAETPEVQILNIDQSGSYLVSLQVVDDLGRSSHSGIEPTQSTVPPYGFSFPASSSMAAVRVKSLSGLTKVAYGERQWLEHGLWPLIDRIDQNSSAIDSIASLGNGQIYADDIYEFTTGHEIHVHHRVRVDQIRNRTKNMFIAALTPSGALGISSAGVLTLASEDDLSINAGSNFSLSAAGGTSTISTNSDSVSVVSPQSSLLLSDDVTVTSAQGTVLIGADGNISNTVVSGTGSFKVLFPNSSNTGRKIELGGCVSSKNEKFTRPSSYNNAYITGLSTEKDIPFQTLSTDSDNGFHCKMLSFSDANPNPSFSLQVNACFLVKDFTASAGKFISLFLNIWTGTSGVPGFSKERLLELKLMPESGEGIGSSPAPLIVNATVTPFGGPNLASFGSAGLQLSATNSAQINAISDIFLSPTFWNFNNYYFFSFSAQSNDVDCEIQNYAASMTLKRAV